MKKIVVRAILFSSDLDAHKADDIWRTIIVQVIHVLGIKFSIDILLEIEIVLLHIGQAIKIFLVNIFENFLFAQIVNIDFNTILRKS